jgi:hypothetical protein
MSQIEANNHDEWSRGPIEETPRCFRSSLRFYILFRGSTSRQFRSGSAFITFAGFTNPAGYSAMAAGISDHVCDLRELVA